MSVVKVCLPSQQQQRRGAAKSSESQSRHLDTSCLSRMGWPWWGANCVHDAPARAHLDASRKCGREREAQTARRCVETMCISRDHVTSK